MLREIQKMKIDAYGCGHNNDIKHNHQATANIGLVP